MKKAVIISCFNWYENRLKPIRELLVEKGYEVIVLIADFEHIKKQPVSRKYAECNYISVPAYKKNISFGRVYSHMIFARECKTEINTIKPDLVFCQIPPNRTVNFCADYKKKNPNTKLIIDIIDLWPESMPLGKLKKTLPAIIWRRWRDNAIAVADHVFTECDLYQEKLKYILKPNRTSTLYLFKEQSEEERQLVETIIKKRSQDDGIFKFAYLGSMNNIIDIDGICGVIKHFIDLGFSCELYAIGDGASRERFETAVHKLGCRTYFYGLLFDEMEKIRILSPCDFAFNMMKNDISVGLTIKSIDYLSYGLPLINNIKGDTWRLVEEFNVGFNVITDDTCIERINHIPIVEVFKSHFSINSFRKSVEQIL